MSDTEFWELYKHPNWQKKRLEIMESAGWKCARCGTADETLNVHHRFYRKGAKPWEYEDKFLVCLCECCHEIHESLMRHVKELLGVLSPAELVQSIGYIGGLVLQRKKIEGFTPPQEDSPDHTAWRKGLAESFIDGLASSTK